MTGERVVGVGVDLVEVDRMRTALHRTPTLATRVFTEGERAYATARRDPAERFAVRFAAKEALLKALGIGLGGAPLRDIEVDRDEGGRPRLLLHGDARRRADGLGVIRCELSLSHTSSVAEAIVVAIAGEGTGGVDSVSAR